MIDNNEKTELLGLLVDVVEDMLEARGISLNNTEIEDADEDNPAIIYGSDYDEMIKGFGKVLASYGIIE